MNKFNLVIVILSAVVIISCKKENAASKVKKENVEVAKQRDYKMNQGAAVITFSKSEHDFGVINEGDIVETTFEFKNTGKTDLIISNAKSTCGCTIPNWPKEPIPVGGTGEITIKFNSNNKLNKITKVIILATNTAKGSESVIIKADVIPKVKS
ncbi:MAG TPA: hypothetical protein DDZ39_09590 [Flavobacteriaceae bacterium]|jgi:hypothetical protein|nr:hypothetical protein [Flavobacteriaceae bacterium]HBS11155.1 hypothetical protein [Flavobacteriaceae bacterium]